MELKQIKAFIDAMASSELTELHANKDGWTLRLVRRAPGMPSRAAVSRSPVVKASEPTTIEIAGTFLEDATMEGTIAMVAKDTHTMNWTAERLKERKPQ